MDQGSDTFGDPSKHVFQSVRHEIINSKILPSWRGFLLRAQTKSLCTDNVEFQERLAGREYAGGRPTSSVRRLLGQAFVNATRKDLLKTPSMWKWKAF